MDHGIDAHGENDAEYDALADKAVLIMLVKGYQLR